MSDILPPEYFEALPRADKSLLTLCWLRQTDMLLCGYKVHSGMSAQILCLRPGEPLELAG